MPLRVVDRGGALQLTFAWDGRTLVSLAIGDGTRAGAVVVGGDVIAHPLLGDAHVIEVDGTPVTAMSAIDWARPTEIPTIAAPARVPAGAGGAILNAIAWLAARAGVSALRYAGPYPTPALWRALARSFRARGGDEAQFTADVVDRAMTLARDPIAIDFVPAPFERVALGGGNFVDLRDGVERASLSGVTYERDGSPARLVALPDGLSAELWFGDGPFAHVARLATDGALVDGPHRDPAADVGGDRPRIFGRAARRGSPRWSPMSSPRCSPTTRARSSPRAHSSGPISAPEPRARPTPASRFTPRCGNGSRRSACRASPSRSPKRSPRS